MQATLVQTANNLLASLLDENSSVFEIGLVLSRVLTCIRLSNLCEEPELILLTCILNIKKSVVQTSWTIKILVVCGRFIPDMSTVQPYLFDCVLREYVDCDSESIQNRLCKIMLYLLQTRKFFLHNIDRKCYDRAKSKSCFSSNLGRKLFNALLSFEKSYP